jgi:hypothetical protein
MCCFGSQEHRRGSKALEQKRQAGLWPLSFDRIWQALIERHGKQSDTKRMIDLLKLSQKYGHQKLRDAIESALATDRYDTAAVRHLLDGDELGHISCEAIDCTSRLDTPINLVTPSF